MIFLGRFLVFSLIFAPSFGCTDKTSDANGATQNASTQEGGSGTPLPATFVTVSAAFSCDIDEALFPTWKKLDILESKGSIQDGDAALFSETKKFSGLNSFYNLKDDFIIGDIIQNCERYENRTLTIEPIFKSSQDPNVLKTSNKIVITCSQISALKKKQSDIRFKVNYACPSQDSQNSLEVLSIEEKLLD